jgi:hypothetical protein
VGGRKSGAEASTESQLLQENRMEKRDRIIKIFGLQRTGTNYVEWLIRNNFKNIFVFTNQLGWKHGLPPNALRRLMDSNLAALDENDRAELFKHKWFSSSDRVEPIRAMLAERRINFVFMIKDPYSWYLSFARYSGFRPFPIRIQAIQKWNQFYQSAIAFQAAHSDCSIMIKYEDLLGNMPATMDRVRLQFGFPPVATYLDISRTLRPGFVVSQNEFNRGYYLEEKFLERYKPDDKLELGKQILPELAAQFGYRILLPTVDTLSDKPDSRVPEDLPVI